MYEIKTASDFFFKIIYQAHIVVLTTDWGKYTNVPETQHLISMGLYRFYSQLCNLFVYFFHIIIFMFFFLPQTIY